MGSRKTCALGAQGELTKEGDGATRRGVEGVAVTAGAESSLTSKMAGALTPGPDGGLMGTEGAPLGRAGARTVGAVVSDVK